MKYNLIGNKVGSNILDSVLYRRGINNVDLFINPDNSSDSKLKEIMNIDKGISLIQKHLYNKIAILVDSDCDGITSGSIMYKYLKAINPNAYIKYFLHRDKTHGLTDEFMEYVKMNEFDLIIVPDAGSNDVKEIEEIEVKLNCNVLVIDHHEVEVESKYGVIINNQVCKNTNSNLTGAGLTFRFCEALNEIYNVNIMGELANLAMLGLIGDNANLVDNEVRNICLKSIKKIEHPFIKAVYELKEKNLNNLSMKDLSFGGVIPMINSVLRVGTLEEKRMLFEILSGIVDLEARHTVTKRKLNKETRKYEQVDFVMNCYEYANEVCVKVKARQDKLTKKYFEKLSQNFIPSLGVQFFILPADDEIKGLVGLIAMKLSEKFGQPAIVAWLNKNNEYQGSLRGNEKVMPDFKAWCTETGLFELVMGHANAAGIVIKRENVSKLYERAAKVVPQEICYDVDEIYKRAVSIEDVYIIGNSKGLWGNGCKEPLFAIENIEIPKSAIQHTKNTLRIWINGITYIKFKVSEQEYDRIKMHGGFSDKVTMNLIASFAINEYNGNSYPQVMITDYEIVERTIEPAIFSIFG